MRHTLQLLALIACAGVSTPALACLNDRELPTHEREFRRDYNDPERELNSPSDYQTPSRPRFDLANGMANPIMLGSGAALLTGAFFLSVNTKRSRP